MATVGFVGLGIMGRPMLNNLLKAGHTVVAYGRNPKKLDACVADGAQRAASNREVGERAPIVFTMLPDGPEVEEVVLGPNGILEGCKAGSLIVDMSSISPLVTQKVAAACAAKSVAFIDAPVSGGEPKAIEGTLAIMVGGSRAAFQRAEPLLQCMGSEHYAHRASGRGQHHQARQPDHGGVQHRGDGRGAGAVLRGAGSIPKWCSMRSRAAWPVAPCSTPRRPCSSPATSRAIR